MDTNPPEIDLHHSRNDRLDEDTWSFSLKLTTERENEIVVAHVYSRFMNKEIGLKQNKKKMLSTLISLLARVPGVALGWKG